MTLGAVAVCAGAGLTAVHRESEQVRAQVGGPVAAVVVQGRVSAGTRLTPAVVARQLTMRQVPQPDLFGGGLSPSGFVPGSCGPRAR
jgi:phage tail tape-measure protein